jgi:predicted ester cyclase
MHEISGIVRGFIEEVLNQGRLDVADRFFWEDMVEQVPFPGQGPGIEGLKDVVRAMRVAFPDMCWHIEEQLTEGNRVLTRFEWTGTHRGEFLGVGARGARSRYGAW